MRSFILVMVSLELCHPIQWPHMWLFTFQVLIHVILYFSNAAAYSINHNSASRIFTTPQKVSIQPHLPPFYKRRNRQEQEIHNNNWICIQRLLLKHWHLHNIFHGFGFNKNGDRVKLCNLQSLYGISGHIEDTVFALKLSKAVNQVNHLHLHQRYISDRHNV